jgi:co-chaperonin GroES (HSP10)
MIELVRPLHDKVIFVKNGLSNTTEAGVIISTGKYEYFDNCKVLAIGDDVKDISVGDLIYVDFRKSEPFKFDKETYFITTEQDILAVAHD